MTTNTASTHVSRPRTALLIAAAFVYTISFFNILNIHTRTFLTNGNLLDQDEDAYFNMHHAPGAEPTGYKKVENEGDLEDDDDDAMNEDELVNSSREGKREGVGTEDGEFKEKQKIDPGLVPTVIIAGTMKGVSFVSFFHIAS